MWACVATTDCFAQWKTGVELRRTLEAPLDAVTFSGKPLRGALERVSQTQQVAIYIDRGVDADQIVEFSSSGLPLSLTIARLVDRCGARACQIGPVTYIAPPETAALLATVVEMRREEMRQLPAAAKARLLKSTPLKWQRMTTPRDVLDALEAEYGVRIAGKENVPHDLWPAVDLPPLDFAEKLSLALAGFRVTFAFSPDGAAVRLVAMPSTAKLQRRYGAGDAAGRIAEQLSRQFPDATIQARGAELNVDAAWEVHDAIERLLAGERTRPAVAAPAEGDRHYTLTVANQSVGQVLRALGAKLGKKVVFDVKNERRLKAEASFEVKQVSLEDLLSAAVKPAGLQFKIEGDVIRVFD
ncbi:MAG: hypothetical protein KDA41_19685 [Planctomycetales bacterium]|nr:hypothetical protein [Planctomycetales bacterium]